MSIFTRFSPLRAFRDLRAWLASRKPYEVGFLALSIATTWTVILVFSSDTNVAPEYVEPDIIYVQSYAANRTDAEIIAQQKIDLPKEQARKKAIEDAQEKRRQEFKKIDDKLKSWGI
ncbi:hypothetical protein [Sphingomonas soli]|uniref:hypothetical protein n=1 Tax=Sphingomonas soli TaxID=266127 RepID=UPI000835F66C|nr:hypothetical protein [Sphingomonas soli]